MGNKDIILEFIKKSRDKYYCDDCLSEILDIKPRQQINQRCNELKNEKIIRRIKQQCCYCSKDKLVNQLK